MNSDKYSTTLYVASILGRTVPSRAEVRKSLWEQFKEFADQEGLSIIEEEWKQWIVYDGTPVSFRVMDMPVDKLYFLSFQPTGKVSFWGKRANEKATTNVLEFCNKLGSEISVSTTEDLLFERVQLSNQESIDISEWEVSCPFSKPPTKTRVRDFLSKCFSANFENIFLSIPKDNQFHIFTQTYYKGVEPFPTLRNALSDCGKVVGPRSFIKAKEVAESLARRIKEKAIFVFLEEENMLKKWYESYKIYFDSNRVPTQYVIDKTVREKIPKLPGVRANLVLEMLTKMGKQPVVLQAPEEIFINDGFLCLSDIVSTTRVQQRLFGALFTYSKQGLAGMREEVQVYDDIKFETPTNYSIEITKDNVDLLASKIKTLIGRRLKIDILLTKLWKEENIERLVTTLLENRIETEKVYYISSKTARFVDEYLLERSNYRSFRHPYKILGKRIAFLKTCTETRIYPNLFSLYIELMWPKNAQIAQGDLEKILWLTKKRIYRIQEFHVLKNAEPVYIFKNLRKMYLGKIGERLTIPLRLLI